jgi:Secretion system C-terminal sorting domain
MKTTIMIMLFFGAFVSKTQAQQSTNSSGGNATGSGGKVSYSVGQIVYTSTAGSGGSASQGVQQPYEIFTLGIDDFSNINLTMIVYPNPTTTLVNLKIENYTLDNLAYNLFDMRGRQIATKKITQDETQIQMENLASATYFLNVLDNNKLLKTFKIIKKE